MSESVCFYAYNNVKINMTFIGCNFSFQDSQSQQYAFASWTTGTGAATLQVIGSRFYGVTESEIFAIAGSTNAVTYVLGYNTGIQNT